LVSRSLGHRDLETAKRFHVEAFLPTTDADSKKIVDETDF
jgi:hypothetical protein